MQTRYREHDVGRRQERTGRFHIIYVSVNAVAAHQRSRRREAVTAIRHVFLDADESADQVLDAIARRRDIPCPSYVLRSSLGRAHLLWRVSGFTCQHVEGVQKRLARELKTDMAATACTQMTRLPGFVNHKYPARSVVTVKYRNASRTFAPSDFPAAQPPTLAPAVPRQNQRRASAG